MYYLLSTYMFVQKNYLLHQLDSLFFYYHFLISTFTYSLLMQKPDTDIASVRLSVFKANKCCNATLQFGIGQKALSVLPC